MTEETENLVLLLLRDIRKEQAEQRSVLIGSVGSMQRLDEEIRRLGDELRRLEQRFETRLTAVRDDLELMLKSELLGRLTHFKTTIDEKLETLSQRVSALEA